MFRAAFTSTALLLTLGLHSPLHAAVVYGEPALGELIGSRSKSQIAFHSSPVWGQSGTSEQVSWQIVNNLNGTFTYTYTFSGFNSPGTISHFTLDVSDNPSNDPNIITGATLNGAAISSANIEITDGIMDSQFLSPGIASAVKFNVGTTSTTAIYSFTSDRSPVYGHFLVKGGKGNLATNLGFGNDTSTDVLDYIPRPNGVAVPEPSAFLFLSVVMLLGRVRSRLAAAEEA